MPNRCFEALNFCAAGSRQRKAAECPIPDSSPPLSFTDNSSPVHWFHLVFEREFLACPSVPRPMQATERLWAIEEFGNSKLGDTRRASRLISMATGLAKNPGGKVSEVFEVDAHRQGAYDFLESSKVSVAPIEAALSEACARRASEKSYAFGA